MNHQRVGENDQVKKAYNKQNLHVISICKNIKQSKKSLGVLTYNGVFSLDNPEFVAGFCNQNAKKERTQGEKDDKQKKDVMNNILIVKIGRKKKGHENEHICEEFVGNECKAYLLYKFIEGDPTIPNSVVELWKREIMQCHFFIFSEIGNTIKNIVKKIRMRTVSCHPIEYILVWRSRLS